MLNTNADAATLADMIIVGNHVSVLSEICLQVILVLGGSVVFGVLTVMFKDVTFMFACFYSNESSHPGLETYPSKAIQ